MQGIQREIKSKVKMGQKYLIETIRNISRIFLAQSIEEFRKSLSYKLFMLEGKRLIVEIAIANFWPKST